MTVRTLFLSFILSLLFLVGFTLTTPTTHAEGAKANQPLFIKNIGQFDPHVQYQIWTGDTVYWVTDSALWVSALSKTADGELLKETAVLEWQGQRASATPGNRFATQVTYMQGDIFSNVPVYDSVTLNGVGLTIQAHDGHILLTKTADSSVSDLSSLTIRGAEITDSLLTLPSGKHALHIGEEVDSAVCPPSSDLHFSTVIGNTLTEEGNSIAIDANEDVYIGGTTFSTTFPSIVGVETVAEHGVDITVFKFDTTLSTLEYVIWVNPPGENDEDYGISVDIDGAGNAYLGGLTRSPQFCDSVGNPGGFQTTFGGNTDGFLLKVTADGSAAAYCTFLGDSDLDVIRGVDVDSAGHAYVTGGTWSPSFPTTTGPALSAQRDVFIAKFNRAGDALAYSRLFGGNRQEEGLDLAVSPSGNAYVTGWMFSTDAPMTAGAYDTTHGGSVDAFVLGVGGTGNLLFGTYLGAAGEDRGYAIDLDNSGGIYVGGTTGSADFPTVSAFDSSFAEGGFGYDGFVSKLNATGSGLQYSTYLGGLGEDRVFGINVPWDDHVYATGFTWARDFPTTTDSLDSTLGGQQDAFLTRLDTTGGAPLYSTLWGGSDWDRGFDIALDGQFDVYLVGDTRSSDFCTTAGAYSQSVSGDYDIFVSHFTPGGNVPTAVDLNSHTTQITQPAPSSPLGALLFLTTLTILAYFRSKID